MGTWELAHSGGIPAERELWHPSHRDDWPEDELRPGVLATVLPPPCPGCVGELWRWVTDNQHQVDRIYEQTMKRWRALPESKRVGPEPVKPAALTVLRYQLRHYRGCTGKPATYRNRGDYTLELKPHSPVED